MSKSPSTSPVAPLKVDFASKSPSNSPSGPFTVTLCEAKQTEATKS